MGNERCHFCPERARVEIRFLRSEVLREGVSFYLCYDHLTWIEKLGEAERIIADYNRSAPPAPA